MLQDNPLLAQLKQQLHKQTPRVEGIVRAHEKGYGFLETDNKKEYFISMSKMKSVLNGDRVSGQIITHNNKTYFEPETLIESALQTFLGRVDFAGTDFKNNVIVIVPEHLDKVSIRCEINQQVMQCLKIGDWVKAQLIVHPLDKNNSKNEKPTDKSNYNKNHFLAEITQFIATGNSPHLLWLKTLTRYNLDTLPPSGELFTLNESELAQRADLTHIDFFTIDGKETMDMDDAIAISQDQQNNTVLSVAIADPSSYFSHESSTDNDAMRRSFSTYLPNFSVPMLPKILSNELCSLKENEKRPALVCQITITPEGDIVHEQTQFHLAWIKSKAKLSYHDVSDFIEKEIALPNITSPSSQIPHLPQRLFLLKSLAELRTQWRYKHALRFKDSNEYRFIFDENRQLVNIIKESKRIAHKMVEEAMVIANQAFTHKISHELGVAIFNSHLGFDAKHFDLIVKLLHKNQLEGFDKEKLATFDGYKDLRHLIENNERLEHQLRRFHLPADLSIEPKAHFAMGFNAYATWTSPIRKYGDLLNHRLIKALLLNQSPTKPNQQVLSIINQRRKALRLAEREINEKLYGSFLANKIRQIFRAEIIDVNRGGAKVRLTDIGAVAFMPLSLIHPVRNEIMVNPEDKTIKIKDGNLYQLLNSIDVTINEVKTDSSTIIVALANQQPVS